MLASLHMKPEGGWTVRGLQKAFETTEERYAMHAATRHALWQPAGMK